MDDDPMAYLNAKRKEMAELAAVAQMQSDLAQQVSSRMETIESLLNTPKSSSSCSSNNEDPEVDYWRQKLVELSAPIPGTEKSTISNSKLQDLSYSSPSRSNSYHKSPINNNSPHSPHIAAVFAHDSSNASRHKLLQPNVAEDKGICPSPSTSSYKSTSQRSSTKQSDMENFIPSFASSSPRKDTDSPTPRVNTKEDPEVDYWRRKIAELSANDPSSTSSGYHTTSLPADLSPSLRRTMGQPPPTRPNLTNPRYKARSLAEEPLSWEGTASFAAENESPDSKHSSSEQRASSPSSSSSSWRSEMKQLFDGDSERK